MRNIRLIQICCLLICSSHIITKAQPYESVFGKDTTQWNVVYHIPDYFPTFIFKAYGEKLISGKKYVPVYKGYHDTALALYGYFIEEVNFGKLWFLNLNGQEELIMDLSLEKGDSFYFGREKIYSYTVDSVYFESGKKTISFETAFSKPVLFIEGLGPFNMFYNLNVSLPEYAQIRCKKKDNNLVFMNSDYCTCFDTITSVGNIPNESFTIYPNPVNEYINIYTNSTKCGTFELFNNLGYQVLSKNVMGDEQIFIGNLPKGVYLVKYREQIKNLTTKITKQ